MGLIDLKPLLEKLKAALEQIAKLFTRAKMASSNLLPRFNWRYTEDIRAMEDSRKRVNRKAISLVTPWVGVFFKHTQFDGEDPNKNCFMMTVFSFQKGKHALLDNF